MTDSVHQLCNTQLQGLCELVTAAIVAVRPALTILSRSQLGSTPSIAGADDLPAAATVPTAAAAAAGAPGAVAVLAAGTAPVALGHGAGAPAAAP